MKSIWEHRDRRLWKIAIGIFVVGLACTVNAVASSSVGFYYLALFLFFLGVVVWFARLGSEHGPSHKDSDQKQVSRRCSRAEAQALFPEILYTAFIYLE